jgi:hypothetical protein
MRKVAFFDLKGRVSVTLCLRKWKGLAYALIDGLGVGERVASYKGRMITH